MNSYPKPVSVAHAEALGFSLGESYSGYDIDYAPRGQTWFVLSGENDQNVFYEKVMFSCSGRIISSFALIYPIARKAIFDPVVEGIEKTFKPAQILWAICQTLSFSGFPTRPRRPSLSEPA